MFVELRMVSTVFDRCMTVLENTLMLTRVVKETQSIPLQQGRPPSFDANKKSMEVILGWIP